MSQNAFLHVLCGLFGLEFGYTIEEVKTDLKKMFPDIGIYTKKGKAYLKSTKDMDSKELTELIELFRRYSAQAGLYLPDAEEYLKDSLYFDSQAQSRWLQ